MEEKKNTEKVTKKAKESLQVSYDKSFYTNQLGWVVDPKWLSEEGRC